MANIDSTAVNTNRMREHVFLKQIQGAKQQEQEEDICMCSNVVNFKLSVCLNLLQPPKQIDEQSAAKPQQEEAAANPGDAQAEGTLQKRNETKASPVQDDVTGDGGKFSSSEVAPPLKTSRQTAVLATLQDVLLANPTDKCIVSDVDEQMLISVFFNSPVRITSIAIRSTVPPPGFEWKQLSETDDSDVEQDELPEEGTISEPKLVKVYSNNANLDFSTVADETPAQILRLSRQQLNGEGRLPLRGSKFQRCSSLHLFVERNQSNSMHTFINRICIYGYVNRNYAS